MSSLYFKSLDDVAGKRYLEKLTVQEEILPDPMDEDLKMHLFSHDLKKLPKLTFGDLYMYLVISNNVFTSEKFKNYKALESYNFLLSGKIFDLQQYRNEKLQICIVTCNVQASQTLGKFHKPWAVVKCAGTILSAHCSCMAGLGEACSHVAALFFSVEAAAREDITNPACTSLPCSWNKTSKKVAVIPAADIAFTHKSRKIAERKESDMSLPSEEAYAKFFNFVKTHNPSAPALTLFTDSEDTDTATSDCEGESVNLIGLVKKMCPASKTLSFQQKVDGVLKHLLHVKVDRESIEEETRNQATSDSWMFHRQGRITSSIFHRVLHCKTGQEGIVKSILQSSRAIYTEAMRWGVTNEKRAISAFLDQESSKHVNFQFRKTGLMIDSDFCFLGASPDGQVICDCCDPALIEIKCPYSIRDAKIANIRCLDKEMHLKSNHEYYAQVQGQMAIWQVFSCYFVIFTNVDLLIQKIYFDEQYWNECKPSLLSFFKEHVLPEILKGN